MGQELTGIQKKIVELTASDMMIKNVECFTFNCTVKSAMEKLTKLQISGGPIINNRNIVESVITEYDLMKFSTKGWQDKKLMELKKYLPRYRDLITCKKTDKFVPIFKLFLQKRFRRIIVVDDQARLQGIITRRDVLIASLKLGEGMYVNPDLEVKEQS